MYFGPRIITFYDKSIRMWIGVYKDQFDNQIGNCGYGMSRKEAAEDVKYQAEINRTFENDE